MTRRPHVYEDDPDAPGTCLRCNRGDARRVNAVHQYEPPDTRAAQDEHRRRAGESDD